MNFDFDRLLGQLTAWLHENVLTWQTGAQWAWMAVAYFVALLLWRGFERRLFESIDEKVSSATLRSVCRGLADIGNVAGFIALMQLGSAVMTSMGEHGALLNGASQLGVAWIVIRLLTSIMPNRSMARAVTSVVWALAALSIFGLLAPITEFLRGLSLTIGDSSFNALGVIKGLALAAILLQAASLANRFANTRIEKASGLSPSLQVLAAKAVKVLLYTGAVLFAMSSVGIDLTSLAIFSSALGVGIGFGLRTIFSNYVAGVILLMDNSIKPGDTIEVGEVFGMVEGMHGRYVSVLTRDGKEYLIPNELLIANEVINWTYSNANIRLKLKVGVDYGSDVPLAMELMEQAAASVPRVLKDPKPAARLMGFGDNSVDLEVRIWIKDAPDGVANVGSPVLLKIWDLFKENGIEFPFPQRDVLLKPESALTVKMDTGEQKND